MRAIKKVSGVDVSLTHDAQFRVHWKDSNYDLDDEEFETMKEAERAIARGIAAEKKAVKRRKLAIAVTRAEYNGYGKPPTRVADVVTGVRASDSSLIYESGTKERGYHASTAWLDHPLAATLDRLETAVGKLDALYEIKPLTSGRIDLSQIDAASDGLERGSVAKLAALDGLAEALAGPEGPGSENAVARLDRLIDIFNAATMSYSKSKNGEREP